MGEKREREALVEEETNSWSHQHSLHSLCCRNKGKSQRGSKPIQDLTMCWCLGSPHLQAQHPACAVVTQMQISEGPAIPVRPFGASAKRRGQPSGLHPGLTLNWLLPVLEGHLLTVTGFK